MLMRHLLLPSVALMLALSACSDAVVESSFPEDRDRTRKEDRGRVTGDEGLVLAGADARDAEEANASPIGVNAFLWRATLDTLAFMPLASADPFGGVILTDWYEDPAAPGERFKINALILDKTLRSDGVRVSVFKQTKQGNQWQDAAVTAGMARKIEDAILTRAREMRVKQGVKK